MTQNLTLGEISGNDSTSTSSQTSDTRGRLASLFAMDEDQIGDAVVSEVDVHLHEEADSLLNHEAPVENYDVDNYLDELDDAKAKAEAALEITEKSRAVLIEVDPDLTASLCGDDKYSRYEPYVVAFPAMVSEKALLAQNIVPLSSIGYELVIRDYDTSNQFTPNEMREMAVGRCYTRYAMESRPSNEEAEDDSSGVWLPASKVRAVHSGPKHSSDDLLIDASDEPFAMRGHGAKPEVDIEVELVRDREYGEYTVAIFNNSENQATIDALNDQFDPDNDRYVTFEGQDGYWTVAQENVPGLLEDLAAVDDIDLLSLHFVTERAICRHIDADWGDWITGYEPNRVSN